MNNDNWKAHRGGGTDSGTGGTGGAEPSAEADKPQAEDGGMAAADDAQGQEGTNREADTAPVPSEGVPYMEQFYGEADSLQETAASLAEQTVAAGEADTLGGDTAAEDEGELPGISLEELPQEPIQPAYRMDPNQTLEMLMEAAQRAAEEDPPAEDGPTEQELKLLELGEDEIEPMDDEELSRVIEEMCRSKAREFRMIGYEHVTGQEIWECVSSRYRKSGIPPLHRIVNDILSLSVTKFMNWLTMSVYKESH